MLGRARGLEENEKADRRGEVVFLGFFPPHRKNYEALTALRYLVSQWKNAGGPAEYRQGLEHVARVGYFQGCFPRRRRRLVYDQLCAAARFVVPQGLPRCRFAGGQLVLRKPGRRVPSTYVCRPLI